LILLAFIGPLATLVGEHAVLYNASRQFLFVVPPMILLGVVAVLAAFRFCVERRNIFLAASLVLVLLASYGLVVGEMVVLHPYEYTYFSPLVGGLSGGASQYEADYYASCDKEAAQWLAAHYQQYTADKYPTVQGITYFEQLTSTYLPSVFHVNTNTPDFYVVPTWAAQQRAGYHTIYTVGRQGVAFCLVQARG
jgi:hypothetical protein